jgi:hypothetical protein
MKKSTLTLPLLAVNAAWSLRMAVHEKAVLDSGLRFDRSKPSGMERTDFNDAAWVTISTPHSRGWEQAQCGKRYLRGPGWYRRAFSGFCFQITADDRLVSVLHEHHDRACVGRVFARNPSGWEDYCSLSFKPARHGELAYRSCSFFFN